MSSKSGLKVVSKGPLIIELKVNSEVCTVIDTINLDEPIYFSIYIFLTILESMTKAA